MGNGIAHVFAQREYHVNLIDVSEDALRRGMSNIGKNLDRMVAREKIEAKLKEGTLSRINGYHSVAKGVADAELVVEAATENTELKLSIFKDLDALAP